MSEKPTYEELEDRIKSLEKELQRQKQLEQSLSESEERHRAIFEQADDGMVLIDAETGGFVEFNESAHNNLGYTGDEFSRLKIADLEVIESPEEVEAHIERVLKDGHDLFETKLKTKDGDIRDYQISIRKISINGKDYLIDIWKDITDPKRDEQDLTIFRKLINQTKDAIFINDAKTARIIDCNDKACSSLGYEREELLKKKVTDIEAILPDDFSWVKHMEELDAKGDMFLEGKHKRKNGTTFPVEISVKNISHEEKKFNVAVVRDITDRKQAEEALHRAHDELELRVAERTEELSKVNEDLQKKEFHFRNLIESAKAIPWELDHDTWCFTYVGPQAVKLLGYPLASWYEKDFWPEHIHPDDREWALRFCQEKTAKGDDHEFEYRMIAADGRTVWIRDYVSITSDVSGKAALSGFMYDITKRKQAEEALRKSEKQLRLITDNIPAFISYLDKDLRYRFNNKTYEWFGVAPEELYGKRLRDVHSKAGYLKMMYTLEEALSGEVVTYEIPISNRDGDKKYISGTLVPDFNEGGKVKGIFVLANDITDRKQAEDALRKSEETSRSILNATLETLILINDKNIILAINETGARRMNKSSDELIGTDLFSYFPEELAKFRQKQVAKVFKTGKSLYFEDQRDNICFSNTLFPVFDHNNNVEKVAIFAQDFTKHKQAEEALKRAYDEMENKVEKRTKELSEANERLKELDRLKSMFIASMSHELRTPLNSIIGFTGVTLQGMTGELNDKQRDQLGRVYRNAKHLLALITDVIDISKLEAGKISAYPELFSINELVVEAIEDLQDDLEAKRLAIEIDMPEKLELYSDRRRLRECIVNLLSNAIKYTEAGKITIAVREADCDVGISVIDTGIGIKEENMEKIFIPFERLNSHLKFKAQGTGLGLYLCRELARKILGGEVLLKSRPGEGSTFTLRVPKYIPQNKNVECIDRGGRLK